MAYFGHAFKKVFLINELITEGSSSDLALGLGGFFDAKTWSVVPLEEATISAHPQVVLAMGSYRADMVGSHGGYMESIKSQVIDPRYVHRFWKVDGRVSKEQIVYLGWDGTSDATAPIFYCDQTYHLRIDVKGSPILRTLDHFLTHTFDVRTRCCATVDTPEAVDPVSVFVEVAKQINKDPLLSKFLAPTVYNGNSAVNFNAYQELTDSSDIADAKARLRLVVGHIPDTNRTYCSFDPRDHFESEPMVIRSAQLVDDRGDPCSDFKRLTFTEVQAGKPPEGSGETILREMILSNEYRQDPFPWDVRLKGIYEFASLANFFPLSAVYKSYYILYSVTRRYNATGGYDNDQYLLRICSQQSEFALSDFESWFSSYLESSGSDVVLEDLSLV